MYRTVSITLLHFLLIFGAIFPAFAQNYPVQVNVISSANALNYASFFADQNNHLRLAITLTDFNSDPIPVRLRLRFSGPATFYTNPTLIVGQAIVLEPGMTEIVQGIDLAPYLQPSALIKEPFNLNLNKLPSGYYTVCAEVIRDGVNQEVLSTGSCGMFSIADVQPPFLQFPACASALDTGLVFYPFNWTPAVNYFPVMGADLEYTFSLYNWFDPNNFSALQSAPFLIDEQTTSLNAVQVNEWDLPGGFQVGEKYLWRVRAQVLENGVDLNMIENNGFSQWCTFTYGEPISFQDALADGLYIDLSANGVGERKGQAQWTVIDNTPNVGLSTFSKFILEYRKKPLPSDSFIPEWFVDTVIAANNDFIYQLAPNTTYQVRIAGMSGSYVSERTDIVEFTTNSERDYQCGDQDFPARPTQFTPLENALTGIEVQIGQFYMTTTELFPTGTQGHYRGKGTIPIAFLLGARAKVRFNDILIDTEYTVREGTVEVMTDGVDEWLHDQYMQFIDPIYVDNIVSGITVDSASGSGWYIVDGQQINFTFNPPDYPIILNDANGNSYTIWPNGEIDTSSYFNIAEEWDVNANDVVTFYQAQNEVGGFDGKQFVAWHENYEIIELSDSSKYFVANKSLRTGQGDNVALTLPSSAGQVSFGYENGASGPPIAAVSSSGTLSLPAFSSKGQYGLYAYNASGAKIGKLNISVYDAKQREVVIVPIANATIDETALETYLDGTLGEANLDIDVTVAPQWNNPTFTPNTNIALPGEVGLLNKYSDQMRQLRDAYFADSTVTQNNNTYYLFVVNGFDDPSELGYMVRGRGMGFVKASQPDILLTIAHELGHGMGGLEHSWKKNGPAQGKTANLMDYSDSLQPNNLIKAQWKELRDVDIAPSLWDAVEDAAYSISTLDYICVPPNISFIQGEVFMDLDGNAITLGADFIPYAFVGDRTVLHKGQVSIIRQLSTGILYYPTNKDNDNGYYYFQNNKPTTKITGNAYSGVQTPTTISASNDSVTITQNGITTRQMYGDVRSCPGLPELEGNGEDDFTLCAGTETIVYETEIDSLLDAGYSESNADQLAYFLVQESSCALENISFQKRFSLLNHIIPFDGAWVAYGVNVLHKLVRTTPGNDQLALLNAFKANNGTWIKLLNVQLSEANDFWDGEDLTALFKVYGTLSKFLIDHHTNFPESNAVKTLSFSAEPQIDPLTMFPVPIKNYEIPYPYHQFPIVVGAENGSVIEFGKVTGLPTNYGPNSGISIEIKGNQPLYPFELQPDGKIKVTQNYQLVEYYDGVYFTNPGSTNEDIVIYSLNDYYYLDPYEFVDVVIGENYGGAGYDKGDVLHVPVIMAMLITQAIENDRFDQNFRIATDIVEIVAGVGAIVAAAPTGGGSLLLYAGIVESIAASADIAIASHQNTLPTAEYNANFYKSWQQVKMIVDIGSGIIAVPSLIQGGIKLGQSVFRYGRNMAFAISLRRAVRITNFANDVENIYDLERALDISEAFSKGKKLEEVVSGAGSLAQNLTGFLKSSYDDLLAKGFSAVEEAGKIKFIDNAGRHLVEISDNKLIFKYSGFGGDVVITEGKVTTVLGKFTEQGNTSIGTRYFLGSNSTPVVNGFPNGAINRGIGSAIPNRMNFLDLPEAQYNSLINNNIKTELDAFLGTSSNVNLASQSIPDVKNLIKSSHPNLTTTQIDNIVNSGITNGNNAFWINYNLPFLEQAFQRGDDIRLVSDPDFYKNATDNIGGTYKKELLAIDQLKTQYGYSYNSVTKTYYKN